jgi:hypothetical protein
MVSGFHKRKSLVGSEARFRMDGWQRGSYPETGFEEIRGDVLERDFSGIWLVTWGLSDS